MEEKKPSEKKKEEKKILLVKEHLQNNNPTINIIFNWKITFLISFSSKIKNKVSMSALTTVNQCST